MESENGEFADYAELYSSVAPPQQGHCRMRKRLRYSGPTLILDFFHVFPGEPVSIKELPGVLARDRAYTGSCFSTRRTWRSTSGT